MSHPPHIVVELRNGVLVDVWGIPPGYVLELRDYDDTKHQPLEESIDGCYSKTYFDPDDNFGIEPCAGCSLQLRAELATRCGECESFRCPDCVVKRGRNCPEHAVAP